MSVTSAAISAAWVWASFSASAAVPAEAAGLVAFGPDLWPVGDRGVEAAQPQHDHGLSGALGHDVRAASRAEAAELAGRGFERA